MKVFMSWSGARSKATAELLCDWTKCVIQASRPWISTRGIDRGALWFSEINSELKDTAVGIVCLTHENKNKPWILFEAGALAKGLSTSRVCTFLVDLEPKDLQDPLAQFNHTLPNKEGLWNLVVTLNSSLEAGALDERILADVFNTYWPQFEEKFASLLISNPQIGEIEVRTSDNLLEEILENTRGLGQRIRALEKAVPRPINRDPSSDPFHFRTLVSGVSDGFKLAKDMHMAGVPKEQIATELKLRGFTAPFVKNILTLVGLENDDSDSSRAA